MTKPHLRPVPAVGLVAVLILAAARFSHAGTATHPKKTSPDYMEGPWMIKRGGKYILFTASPYRGPKGGEPAVIAPDLAQGYWVGTAVADAIGGPYRKQPQVFLGGHVAVFTGPDGNAWFSYRGESGGKAQGRLCIDPIPFAEDGSVKVFQPSIGPVTTK